MIPMQEHTLKNFCRVATNINGDTFVGVKSDENKIEVSFPIGYKLPTTNIDLRKDILNLITVISKYGQTKEESFSVNNVQQLENTLFPLQAYMMLIHDYMLNGYYHENEVKYSKNQRGKINWSKTIKNIKPVPQNKSLIYLDYVVKKTHLNKDNLISKIHEFCVYESFKKIGWLYTSTMPKQPRLQNLNKQLFLHTLYEKLSDTYNDVHKELIKNMIAIINNLGDEETSQKFYLGTERFEYIWEKLIDFTFGIQNKNEYFPKTSWTLKNGIQKKNASLEPDTIMIVENKIYVLDAKYYKYGVTFNQSHLPQSTSINKQITYGEFIFTNDNLKYRHGQNMEVFNAFLMPFDKTNDILDTDKNIINIGEGTGDWKFNNNNYERVQGILIDIRSLMHNSIRLNKTQILHLSSTIESAFEDNINT